MNEPLNWRKLPPITATYDELVTILQPLTMGYKWGEDTIRDLWKLGAPLPHDVNKRIVFPNKLADWLADVLEKKGQPLDAAARVYVDLLKVG